MAADYFNGKRILLTGAASGIGAELARQMLEAGATVRVTDWSQERLEKSKDGFSAFTGRVSFDRADVSQQEQVEAIVRRMAEDYGGFDMIVNNAGILDRQPVENITIERFRKVMDINFWGVVYGCYAALPVFLAQGHGHIVNTASLAGIMHTPYQVAYATSKSAALAFSDSMRYEMEFHGIDVTTICPGDVQSNLFLTSAEATQPALHQRIKESGLADKITDGEADERGLVRARGRIFASTPFACSEIMRGIAEKAPFVLTPREHLLGAMGLEQSSPYYCNLTGQELLRSIAKAWHENVVRTGNPDGIPQA